MYRYPSHRVSYIYYISRSRNCLPVFFDHCTTVWWPITYILAGAHFPSTLSGEIILTNRGMILDWPNVAGYRCLKLFRITQLVHGRASHSARTCKHTQTTHTHTNNTHTVGQLIITRCWCFAMFVLISCDTRWWCLVQFLIVCQFKDLLQQGKKSIKKRKPIALKCRDYIFYTHLQVIQLHIKCTLPLSVSW